MSQGFSRTVTYVDGAWVEGNPGLVGPRSHAMWLGSSVFDGARWFDGLAPDLDLHAERVNRSALALGLSATMAAPEIVRLALEGLKRFDGETAVYIRPMYWAEDGGYMGVPADAETTRFCLCLYESPMIPPSGFSLGLSPFRRPTPESAPTAAKSGCLYPNSGRAILEAKARGFDNALLLDAVGNVAETATSNVFLAKGGVAYTPIPNGTFLNGITRQRVIALLRADGVEVVEKSLTVTDFLTADEVFSTGNHSKVVPITAFESASFQPGPVYEQARAAYMAFARAASPLAA
ncbi:MULTISPECIES: branched-chain amino acid aminotransferase [unclassified Aureimonas]|uniref:branched-chain amino acid aminotransferase n=1 Tax=unclassified Aureimonas TaxID=2615206 RepID=UPI0006F5432B|nr:MULTISPECIES: branched-chain amino acid aminotransferase [unclassified Aureimonas]KQT66232.1 aminotransferase [Aureimonas sp. Leaf427]KQT72421.1 aminotransferase [Aureimonas sp. Leaf460]